MFEKLGKKEQQGPKTTPTQTPVVATLPKEEKTPTGEVVVGATEVKGVIRTRSANIIERVGWTLAQSFVGAFVAALWATQSLGMGDLKSYAFAGGAAALSALGALIKNLITTRLEG